LSTDVRDEQIGIVGVGKIGGPIARSLVRNGFRLAVHDIREEAVAALVELGATASPSASALAAESKVVCLAVATDEQTRVVGSSIIGAAQPGSVLLVHSTVPPSTVVELADDASRRGVEVLDVAINGGYEKAELGTMTLMVGGGEATAQYCWPLFDAMGSQICHVGPVGSGAVAKLVNNQIALSSYASQLEAMRFAAAYGLSEDAVTTVVVASQGDCRGIRTWGRLDRKRDDREEEGIERGGRMAHDLQEATRIAGLRGVTMPVTAVIAELLPSILRRRDRELSGRPASPPIPRCTGCGQELAAPFRTRGFHPECEDAR
jgi:3-hydroxyisobutyrate dehydrogenase